VLDGREVQYADEIEVEGDPWVLVIADNKAHLLRVTDEASSLEAVFLGALPGGEYREIIGDTARLEFSHPRLEQMKAKIVAEGSAEGGKLKQLRTVLRGWAESGPRDEPNVQSNSRSAQSGQ
jgi:hypothetical protein